jgi:SAM-dependent methyltransferase
MGEVGHLHRRTPAWLGGCGGPNYTAARGESAAAARPPEGVPRSGSRPEVNHGASGGASLDTVIRFSDRADDYVKYRPTYPGPAVDAILEGLGPPAKLAAADIGAGTGIFARLLGDRGVWVVAIEPGRNMRRAAARHPNVVWMAGLAEATGLRSASVDLVVSAQSFHWFRPTQVLPELARVLRPGGRLAIIWNRRSRTDPLTAGYRTAILDAGAESLAERMRFDPAVVTASGLFSSPERQGFPNAQRLDLDGFIGRARSASAVPKTGPAAATLFDALRALHHRYADEQGAVTLIYETEVYRSTRLGG